MFELFSVFPEVIKSDRTAPEIRFGSTISDYLGQNPEILCEFVEGVSSHIKWMADEIVPAIDLSHANKVLEIGGFGAELIVQPAKRYKNFQGTVYDKTLYRQCIEKKINECQLSDRIKVASGNYCDNIPEGFDTIVMKCIASQLDDECLDKVLRNARNVLSPGNKFYLIEMILDRSHSHYEAERYFDIHWLSLTDGKIRTREEMETILERNGFRINNLTCVKKDVVIEAVVA